MAKAKKSRKSRKSRRSKGLGIPGFKGVTKQHAMSGAKFVGGAVAGYVAGRAINMGLNKVLKVDEAEDNMMGKVKKAASPALQVIGGVAAAIISKNELVKGFGAGLAVSGAQDGGKLLLGDKYPEWLGEPASEGSADYSEVSAEQREKIANALLEDNFQPELPANAASSTDGIGDLPWINADSPGFVQHQTII